MSTRLEYRTDALREQIRLAYDKRVGAAEVEYRKSLDLKNRRDEWRTKAEAAVRDLCDRIDTARDNELESFKVGKCPRVDSFDRPRVTRQNEIERAVSARDKALARLDSVKASDAGTLLLTSNMLRDWFGL